MNLFTRRERSKSPSKRRSTRRPLGMESLENRRMMAAGVIVSTFEDEWNWNDTVSLREAVAWANQGGSPREVFLPAGEYSLKLLDADQDGDLDISGDVIIRGQGSSKGQVKIRPISGRAFEVAENASLQLNNLSIVGGHATNGGSIYNAGKLSATDCNISSSRATQQGGALYNVGEARLDDCSVSFATAGWSGGAIYNTGTLEIVSDSYVSGTAGGSGGGILNYGGDVVFRDSKISYSKAGWAGGGIFSYGFGATVSIVNGTLARNSAYAGGAVYNSGGSAAMLSNSYVFSNAASRQGGGIYNSANMKVSRSLVYSNVAEAGGGIYHDGGRTTLESSTVFRNTASTGGGVYNDDPSGGLLVVTDSSVVNNSPSNFSGYSVTWAVAPFYYYGGYYYQGALLASL